MLGNGIEFTITNPGQEHSPLIDGEYEHGAVSVLGVANRDLVLNNSDLDTSVGTAKAALAPRCS
jgi:hypothetical protein